MVRNSQKVVSSAKANLSGDLYDELYLELLERNRIADSILLTLIEIEEKLDGEIELTEDEARAIGLIKL